MDGGTWAALITAIGGVVLGAVGAWNGIQNRRDQRAATEVQAEREAERDRVALQTASRADLEAIIGAQRQYLIDADDRYSRLNNLLAETTMALDAAREEIGVARLEILDLSERVEACDRHKDDLALKVRVLEQQLRGGP